MQIEYYWKQATSYKSGRTSKVESIILHSTDGRSAAGDIETLTEGPVSVHWYVERSGKVHHFVANSDTAYHVGIVNDPAYSNAASVGIEQQHIDGQQDWPDTQVKAVAMIVAKLRQDYGQLPVKSHAEVAKPAGRKVDPQNYPWDKFSLFVKEYSIAYSQINEVA